MKSKIFKTVPSAISSLVLCLTILFTTLATPITASAASGSWTGGQVERGYRLKVEYSESAKNPKTNTSVVTATLYLIQDKNFSLYIGTRSATITINGAKTTISNIPAIRNSGGVTTKLGSASATVTHNSDGSKSVAIAATFDMKATLAGTYYGTMSTSQTVALDKLDRSAPTVSLKFNSATANSVNLTATANTTCDTWQYSTNGGSSWVTFGSTGTSNTFTISNLSGGTTYSVVVRARKTSNNVTSAKSAAVTATTKPTPPGGLSVSGVTQTSANLNWNAVTGAKSYKVYLNGSVKASGITARNYAYTGLTANTSYKFGVCATGASGDSSVASTANYITLPNVPTGLKVTNQTDSSVALSWSQNNGGNAVATTFNIYRDGTLIGTSSATSYTDSTYKNTDSTYAVSAVTSAGSSAKSSAISVKHVPLAIKLNASNQLTYAVITPSFTGGLNRDIDYNSLKWAYGTQSAEYFTDNGYAFTNSFSVLQNGTYTVFAKDKSGNAAVGTIVVSGIYTKSTQGAFTETFTDLSVDSIGLPIAFERTYNSMDSINSIFGNGWSLNYAKSTQLSADGTMQIIYLPDGSTNYFSISNNTYSGIGTQNKLVADGSKLVLTTKEDNVKYIYENNYLTGIEDACGNTVTITLGSNHLPVKITDSVGRVYTLSYDGNKITGISDPAGRTFTYVYDESGNLIAQKQPSGAIVNKFVYTNGVLTKITDAFDNTVCEMLYNSQNQVIKTTDAEESSTYYLYKITANGEIVIYESDSEIVLDETDCTTHPASNTYNQFGQVVVDEDGLIYEYNQDGSIHKIDGANSDKTLVVYTYDDNGNVIHIVTTDENKKVTQDVTYTYVYFDGTSNIASATKVTETYTYDDETGNVTETDTITVITSYNKIGNLLSERTIHDDEDLTKSYTYNAKGLLLSEMTDDTTTRYSYNANGNISNIKTISEDDITNVSFSYNIIGQVLTQTENGLTTKNVYDLSGNIIRATQKEGAVTHITRIVYDKNNLAIQKINDPQYSESDDKLTPDANGICSSNVYQNKNVGERYTYDANGNILTSINRADNKTVNTYDGKNRLVKSVTYETPNSESNGLTTRYVYDLKGNLIQTVYPHQYNPANDKLDIPNGVNEYTDQAIGERATYDENGNVATYIDSFGKKTVNTYDSQNHLVKSVTGSETTRYVYNGGDNLLQVIYPDQYNANDDRLDLTAEDPIDTYANANAGERYTYDNDGHILTYTNQFGDTTTNTYDDDGNLLSTKKPDGTVFDFRKDSKITKETYANGLTREFSYTSKQTVITGSNGVTITYNLNGFGNVAEYEIQNGGSDKNYSYTYDSNGNITTISLNGILQQSFTYNLSNELVRVDDAVANQTVTYEYDYVGNINAVKTYTYTTGTLGAPLTTQSYTYNSQNQRTDLSYDANGNLLDLNGYKLTWTGRRLTSAVSADTNISYTYNYDGIRASKTINGTIINYKVDASNNVIEQTDGTNIMKFAYDSDNSPIYMVYNGVIYYYEKNLQGDIVALLDANGDTVVEYSYDIWGKLLGITGELADTLGIANPLRYRGYYYDTETGLYYLQSRYYSPDLIRFISQDSLILSNKQGEPLESNLYVYCLNNPVNNIDPDGRMTIVIAGVAISFGTVVAFVALTVFTFAYLTNRDFRNSINQLFSYLIKGIIDGIGYLQNVISECVRRAKNARRYSGNELHHIVAKTDRRAAASRDLLKRNNISPDSSYNTISIKKTLHKHLHTNSYHAAVFTVLKSLERKGSSKNDKKYRVISGLVFISTLLRAANRRF